MVVLAAKVRKMFVDRYITNEKAWVMRVMQIVRHCRWLASVEQCHNFFQKPGLVALMFISSHQHSTVQACEAIQSLIETLPLLPVVAFKMQV